MLVHESEPPVSNSRLAGAIPRCAWIPPRSSARQVTRAAFEGGPCGVDRQARTPAWPLLGVGARVRHGQWSGCASRTPAGHDRPVMTCPPTQADGWSRPADLGAAAVARSPPCLHGGHEAQPAWQRSDTAFRGRCAASVKAPKPQTSPALAALGEPAVDAPRTAGLAGRPRVAVVPDLRRPGAGAAWLWPAMARPADRGVRPAPVADAGTCHGPASRAPGGRVAVAAGRRRPGCIRSRHADRATGAGGPARGAPASRPGGP